MKNLLPLLMGDRVRRQLTITLVFVVVGVLFASTLPIGILAADGDLDLSFGSGGKVTTDFMEGSAVASDLVLQSDGKIIAVGSVGPGSSRDFALARYNSDGSLDATFGTGGKVTTDFFGIGADQAFAVALQSDGKIIAVGSASILFNSDFALARYNSDGSLDTSFGSGGRVTTHFFGSSDQAFAVALQSDGKIIAVGTANQSVNIDFALARYNSDGSLDTSFGTGGKVTTDFFGFSDQALAVALQSDGKIIAVGHAVQSDGGDDFALARYHSDGSLDTSFGSGGKVTTDFFTRIDQAFAVALQSDGKIIATGSTFLDFALARYHSDGSLDATFGTGGTVTTDFAFPDQAFAVALQSDGKIIAAGFANQGRRDINDFALACYNSDGSLDTSFGTGGKVTTDFLLFDDQALAVALQSDGKIIAAGFATQGSSTSFALARYDGTQLALSATDQSFPASGGSGSVSVTAPNDHSWTASSDVPWVTITAGASGSGNGTVTYTVAAHTNTTNRTGTLMIAGQTYTVYQGAAFLDVPPGHPFYTEIGKLSARGVTLGIGGGLYGPDQPVTRQQMAAFIIRALGDFSPPPPAMQRFTDVPPENPFYAFIEQMALRQITLGCAANMYCPTDPVLRDQMAAFIIRALHEPGYIPPTPAMQRFPDVPPTNAFYAHIEEMAVRQITLGCGGGNYCPTLEVSRGQMAAFLVRAFGL